MRATDPAVTFLLVLVIGVGAGLLFDRLAGPSWLARQFSGSTRGIITSALVGVAGAFVGYHIAVLLALGGEILTAVIAAALGAAVVLFAWRMQKDGCVGVTGSNTGRGDACSHPQTTPPPKAPTRGNAMRNRKWTRREVLKTSTAVAAGTLFAEPVRAAAPPPTSVTPALIEAARKEGKVSYYSALELNVAERLGPRPSKPNIRASPSASSAPAPSGFSSASRRSRGAASTRSTSPTAPTPRIILTGRERTGSRLTSPTMSRSIFRRIKSTPMECMRPRAAGSKPSATTPIW